ncbi:hypothetical protein BDN70DRAFT_10590 [Pholiota conissans]|uniref:DH domain-containing protein n=1 Tax=Pholiota conissans TaxID=109636 RepID=A0A9P5ZFY6_9AGAR|nr:hypothetical protein BDN70DRAFT_10590 [Pholiota conissans]
MLWSFRGFTTFSLYPSRISEVSVAPHRSVPRTTTSDNDLNNPNPFKEPISIEPEDGLATLQDLEVGSHVTSQSWLCRCERQETDFCPYCDYERTVSIVKVAQAPTHNSDELPKTSARRKLRKFRRNYQQLRYEALGVESILAARPDSVISSDSRMPLLNPFLSANLKYPPRVPVTRSRRLEKKNKRGRSTSLPGTATPPLSASIIQPGKIIASRSFQKSKSKEVLGPRPKPISSSIDTDALVSLAWTGETLSPIKSSEIVILKHEDSRTSSPRRSPPGSISNIDASQFPFPTPPLNAKRSVLRKQRDLENVSSPPTRPWTFAMAITDDRITDEKLVDDLEDMRIKDVINDSIASDPYPLGLGPPPFYQTQLYDSYAEYPLQAGEAVQEDAFPVDPTWNAARQVFLLCREFVRTERRYLTSLRTLITNGTNTPPPPSMLPYLPGLITASDQLLERIEANPSVQGVSDAFLACEDTLKQAFVEWCTVVGEFFDSERTASKLEAELEASPASMSSAKLLRSPRSRPTQIRNDSNLSIVVPEPNKIRKNTKSRPAVRDLAILPTQRIMRYVLLFKEFYSLTPTSLPSFVVVEKALQAAQSIADVANEAQGHSAFEQPVIYTS